MRPRIGRQPPFTFHNRYWPAAYYVDATGWIRFHHFGEGRYQEQERVVQTLLREARRGAE